MALQLYTYYRSSCAFRVRLALAYKGLDYEPVYVHLLKNEQHSEEYRIVNPGAQVPALVHEGNTIAESVAIMEYLDCLQPVPSLLPGDTLDKARIRQMVQVLASGIQPLQNLKVLRHLVQEYGFDDAGKKAWNQHWIDSGLQTLQALLQEHSGEYCYKDRFSMVDCCLLPQIFSSQRFGVAIEQYPMVHRIGQKLLELDFVQSALPAHQPDCPGASG